MLQIANNKVVKNAFWMIACKIIQMLLNLVVSILSARFLGPSGYGLLNYAASIVVFITPLTYLGFNSVLTRELLAAPDKEGETLGTSILLSLPCSICCILGIAAFVSIANPNEPMTLAVCTLYSILLIFQALELVQYWFHTHLKSKYPSVIMLLAYIPTSAYKIYLLFAGKSIYWFAVAQALDYMMIALALLFLYKKTGGQRLSFSFATARGMLSRSKHYIIANMMISIFSQMDKILLKVMIDDAALGLYSAALVCSGASSFVFGAIIDSARPAILTSKQIDEARYEEHVTRLYSVITYLSLAQCVAIIVLAPIMIRLFYGEQYMSAITVLRIAILSTPFSYFGAVRGVWLLAEEKQKYLWVMNLSGAVLNIVLNVIFISYWGILGAAIASVLTQFFTNVVMNMIIRPTRRNNTLMLKGLNPKFLINMIKKA